MPAAETITTGRLVLRRPSLTDAPAIFDRYAADPAVTRFLAWPQHRSLDDTRAFLGWSDQVWGSQGVGPYLIADRQGRLLGSTGLAVETPWRASVGYLLARDAWGCGYASEATRAMVQQARAAGLGRLYALCHVAYQASARVLAKAGFTLEGVLHRHTIYPNLDPNQPVDVQCWASILR